MPQITITKENVKILGRTNYQESILWLALSGSGIEFTYIGKKLGITIKGAEASQKRQNTENYARIAVYVNQERIIDDQVDLPTKQYTILDSSACQTVTVRILKLSESAMSVCGISALSMDSDGILCPTPKKQYKLEIIGDSITCGYGIDDENCEHHFSCATEDITKAYSYQTALALDVDYSFFSLSGYGIISGYTDNPSVICDHQRIPDFYPTLGFSYDSYDKTTHPQNLPWDFHAFQPDLLVINLGTNDDSYCQDDSTRQEYFCAKYEDFLHIVRNANPTAQIFCVLGLMGSRLYPWIQKACEHFQETTKDQCIHTLLLPEQDGTIGYAADYHPMERFHTAAAKVLVEELHKYL